MIFYLNAWYLELISVFKEFIKNLKLTYHIFIFFIQNELAICLFILVNDIFKKNFMSN